MTTYSTVAEIRKAAKDHGSHFFDAETMAFFTSTVLPGVYHGRYFVTREYPWGVDGARYFVREATDTNGFDITTRHNDTDNDGTGGYATAQAARAAAIALGLAHMPHTYAAAVAALGTRRSRKVATATYLVHNDDDSISWIYRGTPVVTVATNGDITLDTGGWPTLTTKRRMETALYAMGFTRVYVNGSTLRGGFMPRKVRPWTVSTAPYWSDDCTTVATFTDAGMNDDAYVITGENSYTGKLNWGSNVSDYPRQTATIPYVHVSECPECGARRELMGTESFPAHPDVTRLSRGFRRCTFGDMSNALTEMTS